MRRTVILIVCILTILSLAGSALATAVAQVSAQPLAVSAEPDTAPDEETDAMPDENPDEEPDATPDAKATPKPTPAPTAPPVINQDFQIDVELGYEGLIVMSHWVPAFVTVTNHGPNFDGMLGVNVFFSQKDYDRYEIPLTLASGATKRVLLPIKPQTRQDVYGFELVSDGRIVAETRVAPKKLAAPEAVTIGLLSETPEALSYLNQRANGLDTLRGETWLTIPLTAETFPETSNLMSCFSLLVVDGVDPRTLSQAQRDALTTWLLKGGVVFVSGGAKAAAGYPFFAEWTGLTAGKIFETDDVTESLLAYATIKGTPVGESIWLSPMENASALIKHGDHALVSLKTIGNGLIYTAAFDLSGKPLTGWASMTSIWPRVLRQSAPEAYQRLLNRAEESRYGGNEGYRVRDLIDSLRVENTESGIPVLLILAAYLVVAGFGGYLALKKLDKREWLWIAAPVSAVVFAAILLLMSNGSSMNKPVALTASRVLVGGSEAQVATYLGVASPANGELTVETDQQQLPTVITPESSYYYFDENAEDKLFRPIDLRQRFTLGASPAVGFASTQPWDAKMLSLSAVRADIGGIEAKLWMEDDGVHGEVVNNTEALLSDCMIVTGFGFCRAGDLMPGQKAQVSMLFPTKPVDFSNPEFKPKAGVMYSTMDMTLTQGSSYSYYTDMYTYIQAATNTTDPNRSDEMRRKNALISLFEIEMPFYETSANYYFFAFNNTLGKISVSLDGQLVDRTAHTAVVGANVAFEPIGPTGVVMFHQGLIPSEVLVDMGDDKLPRLPTEADGEGGDNKYYSQDSYVNLSEPVALRFVLPEFETYTIEKMTLAGMAYDSMPTLFLYNHETKAWDEQLLLSVSKTGEEWAPYIDEEGALYCRYLPSQSGGRYDGMRKPTLSLKGKVK